MSNLSELWITLETLIGYLRIRIKECIKEAAKQNPRIKEKIKNSILERLASNIVSHDGVGDNFSSAAYLCDVFKDESKLEPIALPTVIVGTKYDIFETYEPEKKKIIARTLRFMAHYHGAALIVSSQQTGFEEILFLKMISI